MEGFGNMTREQMEHKIEESKRLSVQYTNEFIRTRTINEQGFLQWKKGLLNCSKEKVLDKIPFDYMSLSLEKEIPEYYVEHPDGAIIKQQEDALNEKIATIESIINEVNMQGVRLLQEFRTRYNMG